MKRKGTHRKIGRNDPCWCGSGKKFKRCHLGREAEEPIQLWQVDKEFKRRFETRQCLAPIPWRRDCSSQISRAHTVRRSGSLQRIARNGHVYSHTMSTQRLRKTGGLVSPQLVGINKASTFTGFCAKHDRSIFAPVENRTFTATPEQCFLLSYRAVARETFTRAVLAPMSELRRNIDRGKPPWAQYALQKTAAAFEFGRSLGTENLKKRKSDYDAILVAGCFQKARAYVIELREVPPVMCSSAFYPEQDFDANQVQDLWDITQELHLMTVTSFHGGQHGAIVLSWIDVDDTSCLAFAESLHRIVMTP